MLRFLTLLLAAVLCSLSFSPAYAQNAATFSATLKKWDRLEGTLEQTFGGQSSRARLQFQAPDKLKIEIEENVAAGVRAQTIVAVGTETRIFDPATKRVQKLSYNITQNWWRGWNLSFGGPANFIMFSLAPETLEKLYVAQGAPGTLTLENRPEVESEFVLDFSNFGGSGDRIFYAPLKRRVWNRPLKISLQSKGTDWTRTQTGETSTLTMTVNTVAGLPQTASVTDSKNRTVATFKYALKPRADAFPDDTFNLDLAPGQIIEETPLKPLSEYSSSDVSSQFNAGMALWKNSEEYFAAFEKFEAAAKLAPEATAPHLATFDAALASRDPVRAGMALVKIAPRLGPNSFEVHWRQALLATAQREWSTAKVALENAAKVQPQNAYIKLTLADVLRASSDNGGARAALLEILGNEAAQPSTLAAAAAMYGALSWKRGDEFLKELPEKTLGQKLARGAVLAWQGKDVPAIETENPDALALLAALAARGGRDENAIALWNKVLERVPTPDDRPARLALMALHARRGEVAPSLLQYRELIAITPDMQTRTELQSNLLAAWRKTFRQQQLKKVLEQRAVSTAATEDDARLWLAYQENFGTREEIGAAIKNGMARFVRSAWWRARQTEFIIGQVSLTSEATVRDRQQRDALEFAEEAIALDGAQPYYATQRAIVLTQRATPITGVIEPGRFEPLKKIANEALDAMLQKWPNDPDVQLAVATQRLAIEGDMRHEPSIALLQTALRGGASATDRHVISFAARQVLASALRDQNQHDEAVRQYDILFRAARTYQEELGVALNYVRFLMHRQDATGIANALIYFAREAWPFEESQQLVQPLINVVTTKDALWPEVHAALRAAPDAHGKYVAALMSANILRRARAVAAQPEAPVNVDRKLRAAEQLMAESLQELEALASNPNRVLASRAAALLGEQALGRADAANGEKWFARAVEIEARDVNLRTALATARAAQDKTAEAIAARDEMIRDLPESFETLARAARLADKIGATGDEEYSAALATMAMNVGQSTPAVSPGDFQIAAIFAARANLYANKPAAASAIYNGLADEQWDIVGRAVALIDWEETLRNSERTQQADQIAARLEALQLTPQQRYGAENAWENLNVEVN